MSEGVNLSRKTKLLSNRAIIQYNNPDCELYRGRGIFIKILKNVVIFPKSSVYKENKANFTVKHKDKRVSNVSKDGLYYLLSPLKVFIRVFTQSFSLSPSFLKPFNIPISSGSRPALRIGSSVSTRPTR